MSDEDYMKQALMLAGRGVGRTYPNPSVGCVIVKDGVVIGRGWTQPGGRPHAETQALEEAGKAARGATVYVTLEPCAHRGETPPCADALFEAGVARVVAAVKDPDPRTSGRGFAQLQAGGVAVKDGVCAAEAEALNAGFFRRIRSGTPWVSLKVATSADGHMATAAGQSQWITGIRARQEAHLLRARNDAILTGIGTVLADDPVLTCRLPGMEDRSPIRIVLDRSLRLPLESRLVQSVSEVPVWVVTSKHASAERKAALTAKGVRVIRVTEIEPARVLLALGAEGINHLLIEAGPSISSVFLPDADRLYWFRAPLVFGEGGLLAFSGQDGQLDDMPRLTLLESRRLGPDRLDVYGR